MKHTLLFLLGFFYLTGAWAQAAMEEDDISPTALDRVQAQRVAFITERMDLNSKEAEKFWPLFNEYEREERRIRKQYQDRQLKRPIEMTNEEAKAQLLSHFDMEQELLDLKRKYFVKMAEVVSPRKLTGFNRADREFKRMLLKRIQERRRGRN
ncbi:MAG: hypothetical protein R2824_35515 [Saprospiraceae bacterium]|nr:hypothetical protein [Lewinella sp.]